MSGKWKCRMSSILDIDLDYFNLLEDPFRRFDELLTWAGRPVAFIVENHHEAFARWKGRVRRGTLGEPQWILHVDEHHDMMDEKTNSNIANVMYQAMRAWPTCRVHWLVENNIDSPDMWLSQDTWASLRKRFSAGPDRPHRWPKPDLVCVCTSPEFVEDAIREQLIDFAMSRLAARHRRKDKSLGRLLHRA
jgi:hypothetical protein